MAFHSSEVEAAARALGRNRGHVAVGSGGFPLDTTGREHRKGDQKDKDPFHASASRQRATCARTCAGAVPP